MNIISQFNKILNNFFNKFLENYFNSANFYAKSSSIDNYINFMTDLDKFDYSLLTNIIKMTIFMIHYINMYYLIKKKNLLDCAINLKS